MFKFYRTEKQEIVVLAKWFFTRIVNYVSEKS